MPPKRPAPLLQDSQLSLFDVAPEITPAEPGAPRARRELVLGQHRIGYELKRARRRSIGFVVGPQGLRVSAPRWVPVTEIERALHHKGEWILRKLVEQRERQQRIQASRIEWMDGGTLPYLGATITLMLAPAEREVVWDEASRQLRLPLPQGASAEQIRDLTQACNDVELTSDENLGEHGGLVSILTAGRISRQRYTEQAIVCALARTRNPQWYEV